MKIAILTWWTWLERDIAIKSAKTFKDNMSHENDIFVLPEEMDKFLSLYKEYNIFLPIFHWEYWEDWKVFWFLESLNLRYCLSPFKTHVICMDKNVTNILVEKIGVKVPKSVLVSNIYQIRGHDFNFPLIVKPNSWWSSFATYKVNDRDELIDALENLFLISNDLALIQEFITWTEYSVPVVWNDDLEVLPIMRVKLTDWDFFDFNEKYNSDWNNEIFDEIEIDTKTELENNAKDIYRFLWCRWISRIDFIVNENWVYFLEVNTIPWFTDSSIFPKAWKLTWRKLEELVELIINPDK